jgi:UDP-N-acetylmuramoyl-tripeptide--D-alanyl-D-alanine ligase
MENTLFFCLTGENYNGNAFALNAIEGGAKYVVTNNKTVVHDSVFLVDDPNQTLADLAKLHASKIQGKLVAVAGSNGKTTTKELINLILESKYQTKSTPGNFNNHIGVPLTILSIEESDQIGIIELGTNHPGEMKFLCDLFIPDCGVITNIGKEHLEGFGNIEEVAKEESELFNTLIQHNQLGILNLDDYWLGNMGKRLSKKITYSCIDISADFYLKIQTEMPYLQFEFYENGKSLGHYKSEMGGKYNAYNLLSAVSIGRHYNINASESMALACTYIPKNNRSEWIHVKNKSIFLDAYNANPSSVISSLESFVTIPESKSIFLGDMLELGESSDVEHQNIFDYITSKDVKDVFFVGDIYHRILGSYPFKFENTDALLAWLDTHPIDSKYAFIKGSRGIKMEKILEHFK